MSEPFYGIPEQIVYGPEYASLASAPENWGMKACFIDRLRAAGGDGEGEVIAVLDTGIDASHPEFAGRIVDTRSFVPGGSVADGNGHGTHVAGTAAGGTPSVGVATKAKILAGKCLSDAGSGSNTWIQSAFRWAMGAGATVISMSIGGPGFLESMEPLFSEAIAKGVVPVVAAGNERQQGGVVRFSSSGIVVAAVDSQGRFAAFSNPGSSPAILTHAAPGVQILSARPGGGYQVMSGTCIAEGEYVYTPQGPRKIEQVQTGDVVYAQKDGKLVERVVYGVHDRGTAEVHKLAAAGRDVMATASHEMLSYNTKTKEPEWVRLGQLQSHHKLMVPRGYGSQVNPYLDALLSRDFCWLAGFFCGDGWISYTNRGVRTNFASGDKPDVMAEVERIYAAVTGKLLKQNKAGGWHYDDCTRMAMVVDAIGLNRPANEKTVPLWVWNLSPEKRMAFYEGYRTADGHVVKAAAHRGVADAFECSSGDLVRRLACLADYNGWGRGAVRNRTRLSQAPNSKSPTWSESFSLNVYRSPIDGGWLAATGKRTIDEAERYVRDSGIDTDQFACAAHRVFDKYTRTARVFDLTVPDADCFITHGLVTHNSMATPFSAGTAAAVQSGRVKLGLPKLTTPQLKNLLAGRSIDAGTPGPDRDYGAGLVDGNLLALSLVPAPVVNP